MPQTPHLPFSRKSLDDSVAELQAYKAELEREIALTDKRIAWIQEAGELFAEAEIANAIDAEDREAVDQQRTAAVDPDAGVTELIPDSDALRNGAPSTPGTLRQTVLRVFLDKPPRRNGSEFVWKAAEVIAELERHDWLPEGEYAENTVRAMLRDMAKRNQVERPATGKFRLAKGVRETGGIVLGAARGPGDLQRQIIDVLYAAAIPLTPTELHASIQLRGGKASKGSIHNSLARLVEQGRIEKVGPGRYRFPRVPAHPNGSPP